MTQDRFDVVGIGDAMVDIVAQCNADFLTQHGLKAEQVTQIDAEFSARLQADIVNPKRQAAGSAVNTMVGVQSLGGRAALIGLVSDDELGKLFERDLASANVMFPRVARKVEAPTSHNIILVTPDGRHTIGTHIGSSAELEPADLDADLIKSARITFLEGYFLASEKTRSTLHEALRIAKSAGRLVALGLSHSSIVGNFRRETLELIRGGVDILLGNESEITSLYETTNFVDAGRRAAHDVHIVALTRGRRGSYVISGSRGIHVAVEPCTHIFDITGAGDLYAAGFLTALSEHNSVELAARLGNVASAAIIQQLGARPEKSLAELARSKGLIAHERSDHSERALLG
jgi:sugar/nucleoside kinase (ribokinase family)